MRATVATGTPDLSEWLWVDLDLTLRQNLQEAVNFCHDQTWKGLELKINTSWPALGWIQAVTTDSEGFAFFSFEGMAKQAVWEIATEYGEKFREQKIEETRLHLEAVRDELLKAIQIFNEAISDPIAAAQKPNTNPLDYLPPKEIADLKASCNGVEFGG